MRNKVTNIVVSPISIPSVDPNYANVTLLPLTERKTKPI